MPLVNQTFFWAVATKGLQQSLIYTPAPDSEPEEVISLLIRDCDGTEINKAEIAFPAGRNCLFEIEPLLGLMKLESGMKHGLVTLESQSKGRLVSRYQFGQMVTFVSDDQRVTNLKQGLIPVNNQGNRQSLLVLSNCDGVAVQIRAKLLFGKRSPEVTWDLAAYSSRIIDLRNAFAAAIGDENLSISGRGYVRLSTSAIAGVLMHSIVYDHFENSNSDMVQIF